WTGIVLLAESSENSIEPNYKVNRKRELLNATQQYLLLFSIAVLAVLAGIANNTFTTVVPTVPIVLTALHLLGAYISYLLVQKQLHIHSSYADKICSLFKQQDCNNILESKAAKLWDVFGWSEIGLGYFLANLIILISLPHLIPYLAIINILALPYSFWSVWYQKFKAKQWCVLCLIVQVLLWLIFAVNLGFGCIQLPDFNTTSLIHGLIIACIFGTIILGINILIPNLSKGMLISYLKQEINSIKADEAVFRAMLKKRPAIETNKDDSIILFGNPDAKLQISILTNPFCNPCALMHKRVEKLLKDTENKIGIQYILSSFALELDFANKYLIAVYLGKDTAASWQIYSEWFEKGKDLKEEFFKALNLNMENPAIEAEFQKHAAWREKSKLSATPTILVNGYPLPNNYKIEDLRYFTEFNMNVK
ncbi:MAG: thioredoxin domain-containing protein, partial [Candidatus Symbiothrix sp.]|nr:thioredoxin domain-containing protein [Candidatus Symbiothrix sp.]